MPDVAWWPREELMARARQRFEPADVLLDVGCGIKPQQHIVPLVHVCVEPYQEYVEILGAKTREESDRGYVVLNATWAQALEVLPPKSVDTVVLADVVEHLDKAEAAQLLAQTEAVARRQILVFTPLGFMPQYHPDGLDAWGLGGAQWQEHRSGWTPEDFGPGWEFVGSREFYFEDNLGRPLDKPFGAFWAIRTMEAGPDRLRLHNRSQTRRFAAIAATLHHSALVDLALGALEVMAAARTAAARTWRAIVPAREGNP